MRVNVYLTVDVEIWPDNWDMSPARFSEYFRQYITGTTAGGDYGLPFQLRLLKDHGLQGVFFVEPFFAFHFGMAALRDIVAMIQADGHAVELHAHTEWIGRTRRVIPPGRFQLNLRDYSAEEQRQILAAGKEALQECGATRITAFRAGNFGANRDTLGALTANDIAIDSSYDLSCRNGPFLDETLLQPMRIAGVSEYPMAVYRDGIGRLRHVQIGACSAREITTVMDQARRCDWSDFVVLWHSGELLNRRKTRRDPIAVRRYEKMCEHLARHRERLVTRRFPLEPARQEPHTAAPLRSATPATLGRIAAQSLRRLLAS